MERSEKVFKEFIDLCRDVTRNDTVVLDLLQKRYNSTNLHFLWSDDFPNLIDRCSQKILANRDNKYVYIKEFTTELKAYKAKPLKHLRETHHDGSSARRGGGGELSAEHGRASKRPKLDGGRQEKRVRSPILGQVTSPSCTLIPLSLMSEMVEDMPENGVEVNGSDSAGGGEENGRLTLSVKVDEVKSLRLPQLSIELTRCKVAAVDSESSETSSASDRMALVKDLSSEHEQPPSEDRPREEVAQKTDSTSDNAREEEERRSEGRVERNIGRLEALLKKLSDEIKKLQEAELSFEDMDREDSSYTLEDRYKKRFVKVWNRLCQLKGRQTTTGRETERSLSYAGTSYPEINRRISQFVNRFHTFPDYGDVTEIIEKCNRKHGLGIRKSAIERLAQNTFTDVGNILQKRRMADFAENSGCHLTDSVSNFSRYLTSLNSMVERGEASRKITQTRTSKKRPGDDPARFDSSLRQKLDSNMRLSKSNMEEVINKYAQKQEADGDEEEEDEEEEEEDETAEEEGDETGEEEEDKAIMADMEELEKAEEVDSVDGKEEGAPVKVVEETSESEEMVDDDEDKDTLSLSGDSSLEDGLSPMSEHDDKSDMTSQADVIVCQSDEPLKACTALDSDVVIVDSGQRNTEMDRQRLTQGASDTPSVGESVVNVKATPASSSSDVSVCDVICLDDDTLSPQKTKTAEDLIVCDVGDFDSPKTSADLDTGKCQSENVAGKSEEGLPTTELVLWRPMKEPPSDDMALLSDDDVIVINSGSTPLKSSSFETTETSKTQSASLLNGGEHCIVSTVEEQVTTTVTHKRMSSGNSFMEQKTMRRRVIGHIVCFNSHLRRAVGQTAPRFPGPPGAAAGGASRVHHAFGRTVPFGQRDRGVRVNDSLNKTKQGLHRARHQMTDPLSSSSMRSGHSNNALSRQQQPPPPPHRGPFDLDLDKISSEIASSVFKNPPPGKTVPLDLDVVICDSSSSRSLLPTAPHSAVDRHPPVPLSSPRARGRGNPISEARRHLGESLASKRFHHPKPSKSKAVSLDLLPMAVGSSSCSTAKPLKVKNSNISEIIELD